MKKYLENYKMKKEENKKIREKLKLNVKKISNEIDKLNSDIEKLENEINNFRDFSWYDEIVVPLAKELASMKNLNYGIYGPFGMDAETSIYLFEDVNKKITQQDTWSITLVPGVSADNSFNLLYYTGEQNNEYPRGSIGDLNGMNNVRKKTPDTIEEIYDLLRFSEYKEA